MITTFLAVPSTVVSACSSVSPNYSEMTCAPQRIEISTKVFFLLSPNPGAFTAQTFKPPLNLLTTKVAKASDSTS